MTNPYQTLRREIAGPGYRFPTHGIPWHWVAWTAGTVAIALSWLALAPPMVGWSGFAVALVASIAAPLMRDEALVVSHDLAVLTDDMLRDRGHGYHMAVRLCRAGGTILYRGVAVTVGHSRLTCSTVCKVAPRELTEEEAIHQAETTAHTVDSLLRQMEETPLKGQHYELVTVIISEFGRQGMEVCRVQGGRVRWAV